MSTLPPSKSTVDIPLDAPVLAEPLTGGVRAAGFWGDGAGRLRLVWRLVLFGGGFLAVQTATGVATAIGAFGYWYATQRPAPDRLAGGQWVQDFAEWLTGANLLLLVASAFVGTPPVIGLTALLRRFADKRSIATIGLGAAPTWTTSVVAGLLLGTVVICGSAWVVVLAGGYDVRWNGLSWPIPALVLPLILAAFQEELLLRGYVLRNFVDQGRPWWGLTISSLIFWILHGLNPNAWTSPWVGVNLVLAGWLLGLAYLHGDNLWFPTAIHLAWNYAQGPLLGIPVSGIEVPSWLSLTPHDASPAWLTGGSFGLEGSAVSAVAQLLVIGVLAMGYARGRRMGLAVPLATAAVVVLVPLATAICGQDRKSPAEPVLRLNVDAQWRTSQAVVVPASPLAHTTQLLPLDAAGQLVGAGQIERQVQQVCNNLTLALQAAGTSLDRLVKLNLYVANTDQAEQVRRILATRLPPGAEPALSVVTSRLAQPEALVAVDAVAVAPPGKTAGSVVFGQSDRLMKASERFMHVAVLPAGLRIDIAGQAEKGDLPTATRLTLASLRRTLEFLGQTDADIVQLKSFITPLADVKQAEAEFAAFFGDRPVPPLVFVEWESTLPIEIELIARAAPRPPADGTPEGDTIEYLTPPGMTTSPVYSRVARTRDPRTIFISGLYARQTGDGAAQVQDIFGQLEQIAVAAGSDLRHLAKATYYVADDDASRQLNELRPRYYDPRRPPAASKAQVRGTGQPGRSITLDMLAVPTSRAK